MKTYTAAVIGLSWISAQRLPSPATLPFVTPMPHTHITAIASNPRIKLLGGCDVVPSAIDAFRRDWADTYPNTPTFTDYREMITTLKPEIVSVITPDDRHADMVVFAAENGVKAICCEKPIATTLADADRMIDAVERNGVIMNINHTRRWFNSYHKARQMVRDQTHGRLLAINSIMHQPRSMMFRNGTHFVDTMNFLSGARPLWVIAELEDGFDHWDVYRGDGGREISSEPSVTAMIRYDNGVRGTLSLVKSNNAKYSFELVFENAVVDVYGEELTISRAVGGERSVQRVNLGGWQQEGMLAVMQELVTLLDAGGGQSVSTPRDARDTLAVLLAMLQSHQRGNAKIMVDRRQ